MLSIPADILGRFCADLAAEKAFRLTCTDMFERLPQWIFKVKCMRQKFTVESEWYNLSFGVDCKGFIRESAAYCHIPTATEIYQMMPAFLVKSTFDGVFYCCDGTVVNNLPDYVLYKRVDDYRGMSDDCILIVKNSNNCCSITLRKYAPSTMVNARIYVKIRGKI